MTLSTANAESATRRGFRRFGGRTHEDFRPSRTLAAPDAAPYGQTLPAAH
ncbi:hypothetical protein P8A21_22810 [Streptomyces poriferorum]|nr:hypothetical protein [Streptomyces sp. Alt1]WLQ50130.1 hypothetical protein P8A21_22810 [Streptomyces sp. Alt1]